METSLRRIRTLIVVHDPVALMQIRSMTAEEPDVEVIGESGDGQQAVDAIRHLAPDLVFLDVQVSQLNAFDIITAVGTNHMPPVVLVSRCGRCAPRAFEIGAFDYLLKPIDRSRFQGMLSRFRLRVAHQNRSALGRTMLTFVRGTHSAGAAQPPQADRKALQERFGRPLNALERSIDAAPPPR